ncbi:MAG: hypothetical protein ABI905_12995 [Betaproteobacteria bacterium]
MKPKSRSGAFKSLRFAGLVAISGLGVAAFLVGGSYLFWQSEKQSDAASQRGLQEVRNRLESLRRERADLEGSEETYKSLLARGAFAPERRLDFIETMAALKKRHKLLEVEYEVAPQRPLKFPSGTNYSAIAIMASRVHMKVQAYHDGDLAAFLDEFPRIQRGFFPIDKCIIRRAGEDTGAQPAKQSSTVAGVPVTAVAVKSAAAITATLEAECTLEWITLVDKSKPAGLRADAEAKRRL